MAVFLKCLLKAGPNNVFLFECLIKNKNSVTIRGNWFGVTACSLFQKCLKNDARNMLYEELLN